MYSNIIFHACVTMHSKNAKYAHDRLNTYQPKTADVRSVQQYKNIIISMYTNQ